MDLNEDVAIVTGASRELGLRLQLNSRVRGQRLVIAYYSDPAGADQGQGKSYGLLAVTCLTVQATFRRTG